MHLTSWLSHTTGQPSEAVGDGSRLKSVQGSHSQSSSSHPPSYRDHQGRLWFGPWGAYNHRSDAGISSQYVDFVYTGPTGTMLQDCTITIVSADAAGSMNAVGTFSAVLSSTTSGTRTISNGVLNMPIPVTGGKAAPALPWWGRTSEENPTVPMRIAVDVQLARAKEASFMRGNRPSQR